MKVIVGDVPFELGATQVAPTVGITDYSRRVTDEFGVTTVVERSFSRRLSVRMAVPTDQVGAVQRRLADLRATAATWVADDGFAWMQVTGFYKDFDIDMAVPPLSFCTLTVEGLAENAAVTDSGADPAPDGAASTMRLMPPVTVTDAVLSSSSVAEDDYPAWSAGVGYAVGSRVIREHRRYESLTAANIGNDPALGATQWLDLGPTNRWAMFDQALGSVTSATGSMTVTLAPPAPVDMAALLDVVGQSIRVQVTDNGTVVFDRSEPVDGRGTYLFRDLPTMAGISVTVTVAGASGSAPVSVGTLAIGRSVGLGVTGASPTAGITAYSRKEVDDFGAVMIVQRAWSKRMAATTLIRADALDVVASRIAAARAKPALWIGDDGLESLILYGFFKDFGIEAGQQVSKLSLSIEGLSTAAASARPILVDLGAYDAATTYRAGHVVQSGGASWVYIGADAAAGHAPPALPTEQNAWWKVFARAGTDGAKGDPGAGAVTLVAGSATTVIDRNSISASAANNGNTFGTDAAYSREAYTGGAVCTFTLPPTSGAYYVMAGLTQGDPGSRPGNYFDSITFALCRNPAGQFGVYINGDEQSGTTPYTSTAAAKCRVQFDGRYVRFFADTTLIYVFDWMGTSADPNAPANALRFRVALAGTARVEDITLAPAGAAGKDGKSALTGYLTNEAHNVAADASGNPATYAGASGQFRVLLGTTDVTTSCTFSLISDSIITAAINSTGYYGLTGFPAASSQGYAVFRAIYPGYPPIDLTFTVTKTNAGADGAPAVDIQLTASADYVKYSDADEIASGPVTFTAARKNTSLQPIFRFEKLDGDGFAEGTAAALVAYQPSAFSSTGSDNVTITQAWANSVVTQGGGGFRVITYVQGGPRDSKTLRKVKDGAKGQDGVPGYNNANPAIYQRASSAPPLPTTTATYTFATATLTGVNNGWYTNGVPDGTGPVWMSTASASSRDATDTIDPGGWAEPVPVFVDGAPAPNSRPVYIYQRAASQPPAPSVPATYTFSTSTLSGLNNGWTATIPGGSDGAGIVWWTEASALSITDTDTIAPGEWAGVGKLAQDGANGITPVLVAAQPDTVQLQGDVSGVVSPGALPYFVRLSATLGGAAVGIASITIAESNGCTADVGGDGASVRLTGISALSGYVTFDVTTAGQTSRRKVTFAVQRAPAALDERVAATVQDVNSTSYVDLLVQPIQIIAPTSGKISAVLAGVYYAGGGGAQGYARMTSKLQYRTGGGSWADIAGTEGTGYEASRFSGGPGEPGDNTPAGVFNGIGTVTGLTAGTIYEVRALGYYRTDASAPARPIGGMSAVVTVKQVAA